MSRLFSPQRVVTDVRCDDLGDGHCAVFYVEAPGRAEERQARQLIDVLGELGRVRPLAFGQVTCFAVSVRESGLIERLEHIVRADFPFSLLERRWRPATVRLLKSLVRNTESRVVRLQECGVCRAQDPFPVEVSLQLRRAARRLSARYCHECAGEFLAAPSAESLVALVERDRRRLTISDEVTVAIPRAAVQAEEPPLPLAATG
jgi:hypothetical protein